MGRVAAVTTGTSINSTTFGNAIITDYLSQTDTEDQAIASKITIAAGKTIEVDTINETTAASGVTIDTVLIKDGEVDSVDISVFKTAYDAHDHSAGDPTQVDHANLTNVTTSQHHVKYTSAEAIAAVEAEATLDLTGDVTVAAAKSLSVDTITEKTGAAGVTVDGVNLKDGNVELGAGQVKTTNILVKEQDANYVALKNHADDAYKSLVCNIVNTANIIATDHVQTDSIHEQTGAAGVTVDSLTIKDGEIDFAAGKRPKSDFIYLNPSAAPANTEGHLYYDSTAKKIKLRNDSEWLTIPAAGGGGGSAAKGDYFYDIVSDGTDAYAYDQDGNLDYGGAADAGGVDGADHDLVINTVLALCGASPKKRVVLRRSFTVNSPLAIYDYTILDAYEAKITLANGADCIILENEDTTNGNTQIEIFGGEWDGNRDNNDANLEIMHFVKLTNSTINDVYLHDPDCLAANPTAQGRCLELDACEGIRVVNLMASDFTKCAVFLTGGCRGVHIINPLVIGDGASYEGITFYGDAGDPIYDCSVEGGIIDNIGITGQLGIGLHFYQYCQRCKFIGNTVFMKPTAGYGAAGMGCGHNDCDWNEVIGNTIYCAGVTVVGIRWEGSHNNLILGNTIYDAMDGIKETGTCADNKIIGNNIYMNYGSSTVGIKSYTGCIGTQIESNTITMGNATSMFGIQVYGTGGDDVVIRCNTIIGTLAASTVGIQVQDGDNVVIQDNRIRGMVTPIDINYAAVVLPMLMGNNWIGCTNDPSYTSATNEKLHDNIDKNGAWFAEV